MTGRTAELEWHVWAEEPSKPVRAYAYAVRGGHLFVYAFALSRSRRIDLAALWIEPAPTEMSAAALADYVQQLTDARDLQMPVEFDGLRSTDIRLGTNMSGLIGEARRQLEGKFGLAMFGKAPVRRGRESYSDSDLQLARLMLDYAAEVEQGRGARRRFAERHGVDDRQAKQWIESARKREIWAGGVRGSAGELTPRGAAIAKMEGAR